MRLSCHVPTTLIGMGIPAQISFQKLADLLCPFETTRMVSRANKKKSGAILQDGAWSPVLNGVYHGVPINGLTNKWLTGVEKTLLRGGPISPHLYITIVGRGPSCINAQDLYNPPCQLFMKSSSTPYRHLIGHWRTFACLRTKIFFWRQWQIPKDGGNGTDPVENLLD